MDIETMNNLVKDKIIEDPFDYTDLDIYMAKKYKKYETKFEDLFKYKADLFKIKDYYFYIKNNSFCNAFAYPKRGYNIIGVTSGYIVKMSELFSDEYFDSIIIVALLNKPLISNAYADLYNLNNFSFNRFMLECCICYTFNHEFQHILQSNSTSVKNKNCYFEENITQGNFDQKRHVLEFDADVFATFEVLKFSFEVKRKFQITDENMFKCLLFLSLGGLFISKIIFYFGIVYSNKNMQIQDFYTEKYTHPHPLVRILNILGYFHSNIQEDFPGLKIEVQDLLNNSLGIVSLYLKTICPNQQLTNQIFLNLKNNLEQINNYNQKLSDLALKDNDIITLLEKRGINYK